MPDPYELCTRCHQRPCSPRCVAQQHPMVRREEQRLDEAVTRAEDMAAPALPHRPQTVLRSLWQTAAGPKGSD